ncbi:hypothetical protein E0D81_01655 [Lelliottia amnigena]|nr:hypothetical protein E0D81_01655 [Lelliottia amnigena]
MRPCRKARSLHKKRNGYRLLTLAVFVFYSLPRRCYWRRQFEHGQRAATGTYTEYVRIASTAQVQNGKQNSLVE